MKKLIVLFGFLLVAVLFVKCYRGSDNEITNEIDKKEVIESRSSAPENIISSPVNCGIEDYVDGIICFPGHDTTMIVQTDNGCNASVTMFVEYCHVNNNNEVDYYVNFSNFRWRPVYPLSPSCSEYFRDLYAQRYGDLNDELDDVNDELSSKFQFTFMSDWVTSNKISCETDNYATSLFFKVVCKQRCGTSPAVESGPAFFIDKSCATDGCCVDIGYYCYQPGHDVDFNLATETISDCTDFFDVDCGSYLIPWGDCRVVGCND